MRPTLKLPVTTPSSSIPSKVISLSSCGITKRTPPSACSSALKGRSSILRDEISSVPHNSPSSSRNVALTGTSDPSTVSAPSQSPTSAASGISGVGVGMGVGIAVSAGCGVGVGGCGVARGVAVGIGEGMDVGVGRGMAVGTGEGTTVGVGEDATVGVGGAGRGLNGPHVLSNITTATYATSGAASSAGARKRRKSLPARLDIFGRVGYSRVTQPRCSESVSVSYFTISHSFKPIARRQPLSPDFSEIT